MNKHKKPEGHNHHSHAHAEEAKAEAESQAQESQAADSAEAKAPEAAPQQPAKEAESIEGLKKALAESEDKRIRTLAEIDNLRKRLSKDMEAQRFAIQADTLSAFLQVFDHFSMAVSAAKSSDNLKALLDGMKMIETEFGKAFQELGAEFLNAEGKDFDPNLHEAISQEPSESVPAGKVLRQWSSACKLGTRLLRPAKVVVSSGPEKKA